MKRTACMHVLAWCYWSTDPTAYTLTPKRPGPSTCVYHDTVRSACKRVHQPHVPRVFFSTFFECFFYECPMVIDRTLDHPREIYKKERYAPLIVRGKFMKKSNRPGSFGKNTAHRLETLEHIVAHNTCKS